MARSNPAGVSRAYRYFRRTIRIFSLVACVASLASCSGRDYLAQALAEAEVAKSAFDSLLSAQAAGDADGVQRYGEQASSSFGKARDLFVKGRALRSGDGAVLLSFAETSERTQDFDLSASAYRAAAVLETDNADLWLRAGRNFVRVGAGAADDATTLLETALALAQDQGEKEIESRAGEELGNLYRKLGMYESSRYYYEKSLSINPSALGSTLGKMYLDFRDGRLTEVGRALESTGELLPLQIAFRDRMLREGYDAFRSGRVDFDETPENHLVFAQLLIRVGNLTEALFAAERAAELDSESVVAWNLTGSLSRQLGRVDRARVAFERSLQLQPDQPRTREVLQGLSPQSEL